MKGDAEANDDELAALARGGDLAAFNRLVEYHQVAVFNLCLRMLNHAQEAEDAAQNAFFAAYRSISSFRGGVFRGWLLRIAANQCYDQLRRRRRRPEDELQVDLQLLDPDPLPEEAAAEHETLVTVEHALQQLPPDQRLCVLLVDVHGLDYAEAAAALNLNLGTLKSRLSRARAALRELLGPELRRDKQG